MYERQGKTIPRDSGDRGKVHELHVEGWKPEHNGCGHPRQMQEGERDDGEEHRRGHVGGIIISFKNTKHYEHTVFNNTLLSHCRRQRLQSKRHRCLAQKQRLGWNRLPLCYRLRWYN